MLLIIKGTNAQAAPPASSYWNGVTAGYGQSNGQALQPSQGYAQSNGYHDQVYRQFNTNKKLPLELFFMETL